MTDSKNKVAIIGMSGRFPEAANLTDFYKNLREGRDSVRPISNLRKANSCLDSNKNYYQIGHLDRVDLFDHNFFGVSKRDAELMSPAHRILLELSFEAIENAGYDISLFQGSNTSVYVGGGNNLDYARLVDAAEAGSYTGNLNAMIAGRIAYSLDLRGGAMVIDTSCSSSLVAVHEVCKKIIYGEVEMALAGGVNIITDFPERNVSIDSLGVTSLDGRCKTFDASADGTGIGEGGGMLLLKRLDKALEDNDNIQAVILGSAVNHDGSSSNGLTAPSPVAQREVIESALETAHVAPESISYVEAHGTGTKLGDPIEFSALTEAFSSSQNEDHRCALGALKTNFGHLGSSAGIAGLLKCIVSLKNKELFPSLHFENPNPYIDFTNSRFYVNTTLKPWEQQLGVRRCGVSSFGLTGTNVHMILEEAAKAEKIHQDDQLSDLFLKISAKSGKTLIQYIKNVISHLTESEENINDILYTLNTGRTDYAHRIAVAGKSRQDIINALLEKLKELDHKRSDQPAGQRQIVLLISDQISDLDTIEKNFEKFEEFAQSLSKIKEMAGEKFSVNEALRTFAFQVSLYRLWEIWGIASKTTIATGIGRISKQVVLGEVSMEQAIDQLTQSDLSFPPANKEKLKEVVSKLSSDEFIFLEIGRGGMLYETLTDWKQQEPSWGFHCEELVSADGAYSELTKLYERGINVDWEKFYKKEDFRKIEAPTYPFDDVRCWISPPMEMDQSDVSQWTYSLKWKESLLEVPKTLSSDENYLVFMDEMGVAEKTIAKLEEEDNTCIKVYKGEKFKKIDELKFQIAWNNASDYDLLISTIEDKNNIPDAILHFGNIGIPASEDTEHILSNGLYSQFLLTKAISKWLSVQEISFFVISNNARSVDEKYTNLQIPEYATSYGFLAGVKTEYPSLSASCIDFDIEELDNLNTIESVLAEIATNAEMLAVCYREGKRFLPCVEQTLIDKKPSQIVEGGVYVVTGGGKGIGLELLKNISKEHNVKLVVIGRSVLPTKDKWEQITNDSEHRDYEVSKTFVEISESGSSVDYFSTDIGDIAQLKKLASKIKTGYGAINGIFHLAGMPGKHRINDHSLESFKEALIPKVHGSKNLLSAFDDTLDFFVMFSSQAAIVGYDRSSNYCAANVFQDNLAQKLFNEGTNALSINWPGWKGVGMLARMMGEPNNGENNAEWLAVEEGMSALNLVNQHSLNNIIISKTDLSLLGKNPYVIFGKPSGIDKPDPQEANEAIEESHKGKEELTFSQVTHELKDIWYQVLKNDDISLEDDFFESGGHSINGVRLINLIEESFSLSLNYEDLYDFSTIKSLAEHVLEKSKNESERIETFVVPVENRAYYPASHGQKRLWIMSQYEGGGVAYNEPGAYILEGNINKEAMDQALGQLIVRYEALRTTFKNIEGEIVQIVKAPSDLNFKLTYTDLRQEADKDQLVNKLARQETEELFDLENGPLLRCKLIQLEDEKHLFVIVMHHIISDRWSMMLLTREFLTLYEGFSEGKPALLPELNIQYKDYAEWHNAQLTTENGGSFKKYWQQEFKEGIPRLNLPLDFPRPSERNFKGNSLSINLGQKAKNELVKIGHQNEISLYMMAVATVTTLLYKHTGQTDIVIGSPVSGRLRKDFESQIGIFINIIALHIRFAETDSFPELLRKVKSKVVGGIQNQIYPYDLLIEDLGLGSDRSRASSLFDVGIDFFSINEVVGEMPETFKVTNFDTGFRSNTFDLRFRFVEKEDDLTVIIDYSEDLFTADRITRMLDQYAELIGEIIDDTQQELSTLDFIPEKEKQEILQSGQAPKLKLDSEENILTLFHKQLEKQPEAIALHSKDVQISYEELNKLANRLANHLLHETPFKVNDVVAVNMNRSELMIIAVLGIFKAGGIYLPVDKKNPAKRIQYILQDANAKVLIADELVSDEISFAGAIIKLDRLCENISENLEEIKNYSIPEAYIIYTSGTTGEPKGCLINQRSIASRITHFIDYLEIHKESKVLQLASLGFDASLFEVFIALLSGAELIIAGDDDKDDIDQLIDLIYTKQITVATFPPALLNTIGKRSFPSLKTIISTGEAAILEDCLYYANSLNFYNGYGPTETCIGATFYKVNPRQGDYYAKLNAIPIGKPFASTNIYVLDKNMEFVPKGNVGEIYVSGIGLSPGYLNNKELTSERFVVNPFDKDAENAVLYKTGDLGRWNDNDDLEYRGRNDNQIQLNGQRVELDEIRKIILSHPQVNQAAVVIKEHTLAAFVEKNQKVQLWPDVNTVNVFDNVLYHSMGEDVARIEGFKKSFRSSLKGKVVLDVGTGQNALLAVLAAQAGAGKVYAVEINADASERAREKVKELGLEDQIEIINEDIQAIKLPEEVDYCIFDISGNIGGAGGGAVLINSAKKLLKNPKSILPKQYLTRVAGITLPDSDLDTFFSEVPGEYVKRMFEKTGYPFDLRLCLKYFPLNNIVTPHGVFEDLHFETSIKEEFTHDEKLSFNRDTVFHGLLLSLIVDIDGEISVDNLIDGDVVLPVFIPLFWDGLDVQKEDYLEFSVTRKTSDNGIHPDYFIEGTVFTKNGQHDFAYESYNHKKIFRADKFYKQVFEGGEVNIRQDFNENNLHDYLKERVPLHMVPHKIKLKDHLPLTVNSKIDNNALLEEVNFNEEHHHEAPENDMQEKIAGIWKLILGRDKIGITDNFFEIGGHSLKATQLISLLHQEYGVKFDLRGIFENPTINSIAEFIDGQLNKARVPIVPLAKQPLYEVSHGQKRIWTLSQLEKASLSYNIPSAFILEGSLNDLTFTKSFDTLIERHESLRTVFENKDGELYQKILSKDQYGVNIIFEDLTETDDRWEIVKEIAQKDLGNPFDLEKGPLYKVKLFKMDSQTHVLIFVIHHIIFDAWSLDVLVEEIGVLYEKYAEDKPNPLPPLKIQYKDYAAWQCHQLKEEVAQASKAYWSEQFKEEVSYLQLPLDKARPKLPTYNGDSLQVRIDKETTDKLRASAFKENGTLFMSLLSIIKILLYKYSGQTDIVLGTPVAGRNDADLNHQIGFYLNTLPIRTKFDPEDTFEGVLKKVITTTMNGFEHQEYPFDLLLDNLKSLKRTPGRSVLFDVHVVYQKGNANPVKNGDFSKLTVKRFEGLKKMYKFDIEFLFKEADNELLLELCYNADVFEHSSIELMKEKLLSLVSSIIDDTNKPIREVDFLTSLEKEMQKPDLDIEFYY